MEGKDPIGEVIEKLSFACMMNRKSFVGIIGDADGYGTALIGSPNDLITAIASIIRAAKLGKADKGAALINDMILDAITVNYTPNEILDVMDKRINNLILKKEKDVDED